MFPVLNDELVADRQRTLLDEAAAYRLAQEVVAGHRGGPVTGFARWLQVVKAGGVRIRPIRTTDDALLRDGFARLSPESRRLRFFISKKGLSPKELAYFTDVDHHDHEALVAVTRFGGHGVGVARYIRSKVDPTTADLAVTVVDDWQAQGLGTALVTRLAKRARTEGIVSFTAMILNENSGARRLMPKAGSVRFLEGDRDTLTYEITLTPAVTQRQPVRWQNPAPVAVAAGCR